MKLATLKKGGRDGTLIVVSRDLKTAATADVATLQAALDNWSASKPRLQAIYDKLNAGNQPGAFPFDVNSAAAPLPRAYQWCDGSAYLSHAELVRKARGAQMPEILYREPLLYQGGSDVLIGATEDIVAADTAWGIDLEAEIAIVTDDVPMGIAAADADKHIVLLMLVNDTSLRNVMRPELEKGFGFYQSKPATAFSPVAVTPDELGAAWDGKTIDLPLHSFVNEKLLGSPHAGKDMNFSFPDLIAHAARTRFLAAGTIIGSGTVSNRDMSVGSSCLAERRMLEQLESGAPKTQFLQFGDRVKIEMRDAKGQSIFGAIDQKVVRYQGQKLESGSGLWSAA